MFELIKEKIEKNEIIVIFGHRFPDGDCYGSQLALRNTLRLNYPSKKIYAVGSGYKRFHSFIGGMDEVDLETIEKSLAIIVDANDLTRMEDERVYNAKDFCKIDHHIDTFHFVEGPQVVNEDANSCCEMICDFIKEYNLKIDKSVANPLYLGIMTDTARFQFVNDYKKLFSLAEWLVSLGADPKTLNQLLNITYEPLLAFKGYVYTHYQKEDGLLYLTLNQETLKKFNLTANRAGSLINLLANVSSYSIWAFFCEKEDGKTHAEFRSNDIEVQPLAASLGGGGHPHAAGADLPDFKKETIESVVKELKKLIKKES